MKKLLTTIAALVIIAPGNAIFAKAKKLDDTAKKVLPEKKQKKKLMKKTREMQPSKKLLKDMIHEHFTINKEDNKYTGYFMRTNNGKILIEKIEVEMKDKTPETIKSNKELQSMLKEKFSEYRDKKGLKAIEQKSHQ